MRSIFAALVSLACLSPITAKADFIRFHACGVKALKNSSTSQAYQFRCGLPEQYIDARDAWLAQGKLEIVSEFAWITKTDFDIILSTAKKQ